MGLSKGSEGSKGQPEWSERFEGQLEGSGGKPAGPEDQPEGEQMNGRTDGRTYGISPHSTGLRPLSGPLPKKASGN